MGNKVLFPIPTRAAAVLGAVVRYRRCGLGCGCGCGCGCGSTSENGAVAVAGAGQKLTKERLRLRLRFKLEKKCGCGCGCGKKGNKVASGTAGIAEDGNLQQVRTPVGTRKY